jgi:chemotaxis-related protein WspD
MSDHPNPDNAAPVIDDCWNRIGVKGDGTCPELRAAIHCCNCPVFAAGGQRLFDGPPPEQYLDEQTRQVAQVPEQADARTAPVLLLRLGDEWLGLDVGVVVEIAQPRVIRRIPHRSDRLLLGLANIRGSLELCVDFRELLGIEPAVGDQQDPRKRRWLVTEHGLHRWVLTTDEVAGVHRMTADAVGNVPSTVARRRRHFAHGVFSWQGKRVGYLSANRVFEALEESIR